ncbi:MAG TPA: TIGR02147 family protein [Fibrobacteria bacterium]|nr:TIGR02147 family protein [Fibrobacteria bacterium]HOX51690.1 TIGR02147 family protein [Fibrobacteria bacterium]
MVPVFDYLDYREFLKDFYESKKAEFPLFSYRVMAQHVGMDASNLFRVLQKDLHLPARCVPQVLEYVELSGRAAEYFQILLAYARTKAKKEKQLILEKALALRDVQRKILEVEELSFLRDWWVVATRCLIEVLDGRANPEVMGDRFRPKVPAAEIRKALEQLHQLGLVKKVSSGRLTLTDAHLTAGGESHAAAVKSYQKQVLDLAKDSLDRFDREQRDVSTLALAVDEDAFQDIRVMLRECRRQIQKRVEDSQRPDRVMQLSMAFHPLAPAVAREEK